MNLSSHQELLEKEYSLRRLRNPCYSLRAFSRDLNIGIASVSEVIQGKRKLSEDNLLKVAEKLSLSPLDVERLKGSETKAEEKEYLRLEEERFALISDWQHFAILNLAQTRGNRACPKWIAKRLCVSFIEARNAFNRLIALELISVTGKKMNRTTKPIITSFGIPSTALKKHHSQLIEKAKLSVFKDSLDKREIVSITMAIDPKKLPVAKRMISRFLKKLSNVLEVSPQKEVYNLNIQLFPLTQGE